MPAPVRCLSPPWPVRWPHLRHPGRPWAEAEKAHLHVAILVAGLMITVTLAELALGEVALLSLLGMLVLVAANWLPPLSTGELGALAVGCAVTAALQSRTAPLEVVAMTAPAVAAGVLAVLTARRRLSRERALRRLSVTDPLTGLSNRSVTTDFLRRELRRREAAHPVTVLFLDLDGFKSINDRYGHSAGDRVLCAVADRLSGALREEDVVTRYAGDEFVVVCTALDGRADAERLCTRMATRLSLPVSLGGGRRVTPTASIGGVLTADRRWTADELLALADRAMFEAKTAGGNRCRVREARRDEPPHPGQSA